MTFRENLEHACDDGGWRIDDASPGALRDQASDGLHALRDTLVADGIGEEFLLRLADAADDSEFGLVHIGLQRKL